MEETKLIAKKRDLEGSANARRIRREGMLPGVVYGGEKEPASILLNTHDFEQLFHHHASESMLIEIDIEGEGSVAVLVKDVQHHPVTSDLIHVDLQRVDANKTLTVDVQVELVGEAKGVKLGGTLEHVMHAISVECLPADLVEAIEIDVTDLDIGDVMQVSDLELGDKVKLLVDADSIIATVSAPKAEEEEVEADSDEPEVITEKKEAE